MLRVLSLFSGIGAFETALRRGGYQFETVNYCEIDPYASKAYSQIHGISEDYNLKDVRQVNTLLLDNINLMTWGWPCQDISVAGKQRGFKDNDGNLTRSGLFFQGLRILTELQPEYAIAENVKALTGKKFTAEFETVLTSLDKAGYNNYWKVLNAKDYGIPQNRERVFIISIRKDIDTGTFTFPEKQQLHLRVKDILESSVDEKYYINNDRAKELVRKITQKPEIVGGGTENRIKTIGHLGTGGQKGWVFNVNGISRCLAATDYKDPTKIVEIKEMKINEPVICRSVGRDPDNPSNREKGCNTKQTLELKKDGMSNTLTTVQKDNMVLEPKIKIVGRMDGYERTGRVYSSNGIACNLLAREDSMQILEEPAPKGGQREVKMLETTQEAYRIRKLTPRECFRLMGFSDSDFDKIKGISNTQLYKMAGNSIVVNVLEGIFRELFKAQFR